MRTAATRTARAVCLWALAFAAGCRRPGAAGDAEEPRREEWSSQGARVVMTVAPGRVRLERDVLLTLSVTAPAGEDVEFPALDDRLQGLRLDGVLDAEPEDEGQGTRRWERRAQLAPLVAGEHRIAPMAIALVDRGRTPPQRRWIVTRPIVLDLAETGAAPKDIRPVFRPHGIAPGPRTYAAWGGGLAAALLAAWLAWRWTRSLRRAAVLRLLSPHERALRELAALLARRLPEQDRLKDFYVELTMVVRRYIERRHRIRAPEQTTEEFLAAVRDDPRFGAEVVARLRAFLEAADLVKFAAHRPPPGAVERAADGAREYIDTDARGAAPPAGAGERG
jgi:hypothetical protein